MNDETQCNETWLLKLASPELCGRVKRCFGACHITLPFLPMEEQVKFQGLDLWTYVTGVPRAQKSITFETVSYFPHVNQILQVGHPKSKFVVLETNFNHECWSSIQVNQNIYQVEDDSANFRMLQNTGSSEFRVVEKAELNWGRENGSYCNMSDQLIFATGGYAGDYMNKVERYDIERDVWEEMPGMNMCRDQHGSCTLGTSVYVICGDSRNGQLNSVEKLDTLDLEAGWQLILMPPSSLLTPRSYPVVTALNSTEILIMGGAQGRKTLADLLVFETRTAKVKKHAINVPFTFKVSSVQSVKVRPSEIFAYIKIKDSMPRLIQLRNDSFIVLY